VVAARHIDDTPALGNEQLSGQDAEEHPSDSEVSIHTTDEPGGVLASFPMRAARALPQRRDSCQLPRAEARSRGAEGAERSELAPDGAAGTVASRRERERGARDHAAAAITQMRSYASIADRSKPRVSGDPGAVHCADHRPDHLLSSFTCGTNSSSVMMSG
jgi:hypothetical protein